MYQVLAVDDEPASLKHICNIIHTKCPDFEIMDTARNGKTALEIVEKRQPDVVFSDVMMPLMDGISLVSELKERYPDILSVIVSGYNDFAYAKGAIRSGVCEYILKPVRPSDIVKLMEELKERLDGFYYEKRKRFLRKISGKNALTDAQELERLFPDERYYAAIYRKNGLPSRFTKGISMDMYSMPQEKIIIYGRDEMEALYLCPKRLLNNENFLDYFSKVYQKVKEKNAFYTAVAREKSFSLPELPQILVGLYRTLDENIVIGKNQLVLADTCRPLQEDPQDHEIFGPLIHYIKKKEYQEVPGELGRLFGQWKEESKPQVWLEDRIRYLLACLEERGYIEHFSRFVLDDIFAEAVSMEELESDILGLLCPEGENHFSGDRREAEYQEIMYYLEEHIQENISAQSVCKRFAVSQTTLSKMFHRYGGNSFLGCLGSLRLEKARRLMQENPGILIRDVAEMVGYRDQFYFSRVFRSAFGVSPSEYLEQR